MPLRPFFCAFIAVAKRQGASCKNFPDVQNDILKNTLAAPTIYPVRPAMRIVTEFRVVRDIFQWNTISIPGITSASG